MGGATVYGVTEPDSTAAGAGAQMRKSQDEAGQSEDMLPHCRHHQGSGTPLMVVGSTGSSTPGTVRSALWEPALATGGECVGMERRKPGGAAACSRQDGDGTHGRKEGPEGHSAGRVTGNQQGLIGNRLGLEEAGGPG